MNTEKNDKEGQKYGSCRASEIALLLKRGMRLDYRKSYILYRLQATGSLKTSELMDIMNISERTLKMEIKELNFLLKPSVIQMKSDRLEVGELEEFRRISNIIIDNSDITNYKLNKSERIILEFLYLCFTIKFLTVDELCHLLMVSRGTILADLKSLRKQLYGTGMKIVSLTNHGYTMKGNESDIKQRILETIFNMNHRSNQFLKKEIENILYQDIDLDYFSNSLLKYLDTLHITMTDELFYCSLALLIVYVKRIKPSKSRAENTTNSLLGTCAKKYNDLLAVDDALEDEFIIKLNDLLSSNKEGTTDLELKNADEQMKISSYIWKVCQDFDIIGLFGYDNYRNLYNHIELTIQYLTAKKSVSLNPFCEELKNKYPEIFKSLEQNIYIIQDLVDRKINENDVSYMAMHIASVIEGRKPNKSSLTAIIVCPTGRCTSLLLKARILKYFDVLIKDIIPSYKVNEDLDVDFIISTVPLNVSNLPVIHVNQMLSENDIRNMEKQIDKMILSREQKLILNDIQYYLDQYQMLSNKNIIQFGKALNELNAKYTPEDSTNLLYFYKALTQEHILLNEYVSDWEESIRCVGNLLLKDHYLTQNYINTMIDLVKENGPYIVFSPGFVIAHAGPEDGAEKLGVSVIRLVKPIDFGVEDVKVKFVICMSIPNEMNHVFLLFQIYKCMCNKDIFRYLSQAQTKEEFLQILKIFELRSKE